MMRKIIYYVYHKLQDNKWLLQIIAWLQQYYVTIIVGDIVNFPQNLRNRRNPDKYLSRSRTFFEQNKGRVDAIKGLLADDQSRIAYEAAIRFRTEGRRIRRNEWSLCDQYFVRGIIELKEKEVFVDCGAYNGDTIDKLLSYRKRFFPESTIRKIVAFEPGKLSFKLLRKNKADEKCGMYYGRGK